MIKIIMLRSYQVTLQRFTEKAKLKTDQPQLYLGQGPDESLVYGMIMPWEGYVEGSIPKEQLDVELKSTKIQALFSAFSSQDPLNQLKPFVASILNIIDKQQYYPLLDRIPRGMMTCVVFPLLELKDILKQSRVSKEYKKFIDNWVNRGIKKISVQIKESKTLEEKTKNRLREVDRKLAIEFTRLGKERQREIEKANEDYEKNKVILEEKARKEKQEIEKKSTEELLEKEEKNNNAHIGYFLVNDRYLQLDKFLKCAKEEKENKPWFRGLIRCGNVNIPRHNDCDCCLIFCLFASGLIIAGIILLSQTTFLVAGIIVTTVGIGLIMLSIARFANLFSCDTRGSKRFDNDLLSSFPASQANLNRLKQIEDKHTISLLNTLVEEDLSLPQITTRSTIKEACDAVRAQSRFLLRQLTFFSDKTKQGNVFLPPIPDSPRSTTSSDYGY